MTEAQRQEFREAFSLFDKNGDGHISASELGDVLQSLGQLPTSGEVLAMLREIDGDANGTIEWNEFLTMMASKLKNVDTSEEIAEAFKAFDLEGSGEISAEVLFESMASLGDVMTEEECAKIVADVGGSGGTVNFEQFKAMMLGGGRRGKRR